MSAEKRGAPPTGEAPETAALRTRAARIVPALVAAAALLVGPGAAAQTPLVENGDFVLEAGGYVRSLTAVQDLGYEPPSGERRSGFHGAVARIQWNARWRDLRVEVHDRIQARLTSAGDGFGQSVAGFGVSADPGRAVDLESVWIDDDRLRAWHDVDRVALTAYTPVADVTVGRQAISWGNAVLFPVADLWGRFSPFELDTEQRPGVDAVRVLAYPTPGLEVDAVVADRGARDDVSAGVRATWSLSSADVYGAAGRLWNEAMAIGGVTWLFETTKLRAEGLVARDLDEGRWLDPRATVGIDRIGGRWTLTAELHFNGLGAPGPDGYLRRLQSRSFARGESYYLGRSYLGAAATWSADAQERIRLSGSALVNVDDPSVALLPALTWDMGRSTTLSLGGMLTAGDAPVFRDPAPRLRSEYGSYGDLGYARLSVYF